MAELSNEDKTVAILLDRFTKVRLPRALSLKAKVDKGEILNEQDIAFLEEILKDTAEAKPVIDKYPELQKLYAQAVGLYKEITKKGLENQG